MSSIIVLDSSDEDESPPKKCRKLLTNPVAVKINSSTGSRLITVAPVTRYEQSPCKSALTKQRSLPNNTITITSARRSSNAGHPKVSNACTLPPNAPRNATQPAVSGNTHRNAVISQEPQIIAGSPKSGVQQQQQQCRKRNTPTPPQGRSNSTKSPFSYMRSATSPSPFPSPSPSPSSPTVTAGVSLPTLIPAITSIHTLTAAGAVPPLQLLASTSPPLALDIPSPEHNTSSIDTIKTISPTVATNKTSVATGRRISTATSTQLPSQKSNMNINFKIHLPRKTASTPSPPPEFGTGQAASPQPTSLSSSLQTSTGRLDKLIKRVKPTTLIKPTDEAWLKKKESQRQQNTTKRKSSSNVIALNDDISLEMISPTTIESPKSSRTSPSPSFAESVTKSRKSSTDVTVLSPNHRKSTVKPMTILDLTQSPDKRSDTPTIVAGITTAMTTNTTTIIDLVGTSSTKGKSAQLNGDVVTSKIKSKPATALPNTINDAPVKIKDVKELPRKPPLEPEYEELIKVCRQAEPSDDMEKLIHSKLIKYYYEVHPDFVRSKSFRKSIKRCIDIIRSEPDLVYYNLKTIVDELKVRRKSHPVIVEEEDQCQQEQNREDDATEIVNDFIEKSATEEEDSEGKKLTKDEERPPTEIIKTGNKKTDEQIRKLNKALYILTKRIEALEQTEVDWDDEDSIYIQTERFKKRACQIYEKICDLTGESKNAYRMVKKPIKFNGTRIPQFNKTLQAFINRTKEFPDYYDVLRMLEYCNRTYDLGLVNFEIKNIAEDAFIKVGKSLQSRRKTEVYEALNYFTENNKDPANSDSLLAAKLHENQQKHKKINDVLDKYVRRQEMPDAPDEDAKEQHSCEDMPTCSQNVSVSKQKQQHPQQQQLLDGNSLHSNGEVIAEADTGEVKITENLKNCQNDADGDGEETIIGDADEEEYDDEDDDEYDEDDDDDDEVNLEEHVETLANGDITDNESDTEIMLNDNSNETSGNVVKLNVKYQNANAIHGKNPNENTTTKITLNNIDDATQQEQIVIKTSDKIFMNNNNINNNNKNNNNNSNTNNNNVRKSIKILNVYDEQCPIQILSNDNSLTTTANGKLKLNDTKSAATEGAGTRTDDIDDNDDDIIISDAPTFNSINNTKSTAIVTTSTNTITTTSTANLKIIAVSSLNPQHQYQKQQQQQQQQVNILAPSKALSSAHKNNKSLEEIIISDEES